MKRYAYAATIAGFIAGFLSVHAADETRSYEPAQRTLPPVEAPSKQQPVPCDLKASPDYVPGIDAKGRDVAPADIPSGREVEISTEVLVELRSKNRRGPRTGAIVNLPGLGAPACVPLKDKSDK